MNNQFCKWCTNSDARPLTGGHGYALYCHEKDMLVIPLASCDDYERAPGADDDRV